MRVPVLLISTLLIGGMCVMPPWEVRSYEKARYPSDEAPVTIFHRSPGSSEYSEAAIRYRPVWAPVEWNKERGDLKLIGRIDKKRLAAQILVVVTLGLVVIRAADETRL